MLPQFEENSPEYNEIINRLKICNCFQSMEIDRAKGIKTMDIPKYWTKWEKITGEENEEELKLKELHNKVVCDKRPYFFRYLYDTYDKEYENHKHIYRDYCEGYLGQFLETVLDKEILSEEETEVVNEYIRQSPVLDSDCVMNKITHYCEKEISKIKRENKKKSFNFEKLFQNKNSFDIKNKIIVNNIYQKYQEYKVSINYHSNSSGFKDMMQWLNRQTFELMENAEEVLYWASLKNITFLLDVYGNDFVDFLKNISDGTIMMPTISKDGYFDYMGSKYEIRRVAVWQEDKVYSQMN